MVGLCFKNEGLESVCYLFLGTMGMINAAIIPVELRRYEIRTTEKPNLSVLNLPLGGTKIVTKDLN